MHEVMPSAIVCDTGHGTWLNGINWTGETTSSTLGAGAGMLCMVLEVVAKRYNLDAVLKLVLDPRTNNYHGDVYSCAKRQLAFKGANR
jgi:hypothetical protein